MIMILIIVILLGNVRTLNVYAQPQTLSLAIPDTMIPIFRDVVIPNFQESHPDVYVEIRTINIDMYLDLELPPTTDELEDYVDAANQLVTTADVHFLPPYILSPELTRTGYFLDMRPLVVADASLVPDDFIMPIDEAFAWDNGIWALPAIATPVVMVYDPEAFDAIGLNYPDHSWTFTDYALTARQLANTGSPALQVTPVDLPLMFRIFSDSPFYDNSVASLPDLSSPEFTELVSQWAELERDGIVTSGFTRDAPMRLARISELSDEDLTGVLLQEKAGADVYSMAISRGTDEPELAYQLLTYITGLPELTSLIPGAVSVRVNLQDQSDDSRWPLSESAMLLRQQALENAVLPADTQFGQYLLSALADIRQGQAVDVALQNAQQIAQQNLDFAFSHRGTEPLVVNPVTVPTEFEGVSIQFGLFTGSTSLPNRNQWEDVIEEFLLQNPDIDQIELNFVAPMGDFRDEIPRNDCTFGWSYQFYESEALLALDPLIDADPTFDPNDVLGEVMLDMQRDGTTYAIPGAVFPRILRYNPQLFEEANIPIPDGTWTISEFVDALIQLQTITDGPSVHFDNNYSTPWELLMAAYGAAPIDYTTDPPTLHLTDEAVTNAIRQVLDLAKSGVINYQVMSTFAGFAEAINYSAPILSDQLRLFDLGNPLLDQFELTNFPSGTDITPISFYTNLGFIFSDAPHPEACYRWLREITRHPELIGGMPAYHSMIEQPATEAVYGREGVATFQQFAEMMEAPNRVFIRSFGLETGASMFMARAFDRYVLEDADLETELALAQELTLAYFACRPEPMTNVLECLFEVDPTIRENIPDRFLGNQ